MLQLIYALKKHNNPPIQGKKAMSGKKIKEIKFPMLK
jgi:hypothetical protein